MEKPNSETYQTRGQTREPKKSPTESTETKGSTKTRRDQEERDNGLGKRHLEGRKLELRKETKKHLMEEGRHTEKKRKKNKGYHTTSDPVAKEKDIAEEAIDRRGSIQKQGETEEATGVSKIGQGREREKPQRKEDMKGATKEPRTKRKERPKTGTAERQPGRARRRAEATRTRRKKKRPGKPTPNEINHQGKSQPTGRT